MPTHAATALARSIPLTGNSPPRVSPSSLRFELAERGLTLPGVVAAGGPAGQAIAGRVEVGVCRLAVRRHSQIDDCRLVAGAPGAVLLVRVGHYRLPGGGDDRFAFDLERHLTFEHDEHLDPVRLLVVVRPRPRFLARLEPHEPRPHLWHGDH